MSSADFNSRRKLEFNSQLETLSSSTRTWNISVHCLSLHSFDKQPLSGNGGWAKHVCGAASALHPIGIEISSLNHQLTLTFQWMLLVISILESHGVLPISYDRFRALTFCNSLAYYASTPSGWWYMAILKTDATLVDGSTYHLVGLILPVFGCIYFNLCVNLERSSLTAFHSTFSCSFAVS